MWYYRRKTLPVIQELRSDDPSFDPNDGDQQNRPIYVYTHAHGHNTLNGNFFYLFLATLVLICAMCGGFFKLRKPNAPDLHYYLETRRNNRLQYR